LWLSDLDLENPQLIYTDEDELYSDADYETALNLQWTADDLHLIWYTENDSPNLIYHLQTQTIELWPWKCDRIALSSRTNKLATWCISEQSDSQYSVIEWGGNIWYSDVPPTFELVRQEQISLTSPPVWAWSSDGNRLAYFNPSSQTGELIIANVQGIVELSFPNVAWWQTEAVAESRIYLPAPLIRWSRDSSQLLVFAHDLTTNACPQYRDYWSGSDELYDIPCWQVMESQSGTVLWAWAELVNITSEDGSETWQVWDAAISPSGKHLAFNIAVSGGVELGIFDLENGLYEQWAAFGGSVIRWKSSH
jgi:hypothetical protein